MRLKEIDEKQKQEIKRHVLFRQRFRGYYEIKNRISFSNLLPIKSFDKAGNSIQCSGFYKSKFILYPSLIYWLKIITHRKYYGKIRINAYFKYAATEEERNTSLANVKKLTDASATIEKEDLGRQENVLQN